MDKNVLKQIKQFQKLRAKAQEKGDLKGEAESVNFLGELHSKIGEDEEALQLHKEELRICEALTDKIGEAVAHRKIGESYAALGNFNKALHHQYKHLELGKVADNLPEQQRAYATIGRTYLIQGEDFHNAGDFDEARPLLLKAENAFKSSIQFSQKIQAAKSLPDKEVNLMKTRGISNLAYVYHFLSLESNEDSDGKYAKQSLALYQKALLISQKRMLSDETHRVHIQLTMYYRCRRKMDDAIQHAEEAVRHASVAGNVTWQIEALGELGSIQLQNGSCEQARKAYKKCYRLSEDPTTKSEYRDKLKPVLKILKLQRQVDDSALTSADKYQLFEKIADKFCNLGCYQAAINNYKEQEKLFSSMDDITEKQKATVYYSLGLTSSDLNDHQNAVKYFHEEMKHYTNPKELAKTWSQIGISTEKLSEDLTEAVNCYKKAVHYADQTAEAKLQLRALSLLLDVEEKQNSPEASETRRKISELQLTSGILAVDGEEDSEDLCGKNQTEEEEEESDGEGEVLVDNELENNSADELESEDSRKSRMNSKVWKRKLNEKGETPLHRACIDGHMKRVQLLLEQKHPINEPDYAGWTPLHEACIHGYTEIVRLLIDHGANMNFKANCGTTPMQDAASNGHLEIVALLLEKGASAGLKNNKGDTALSNLEHYYRREKNNLDSYETESYWVLHGNLKSKQNDPSEKENIEPDFAVTLEGLGDIFDNEISTQRTGGLTQSSQYRIPSTLSKTQKQSAFTSSRNNMEINMPEMSQNIEDFEPNFETDPIFDDNNILPVLDPNPRISHSTQESNINKSLDGADEYKNAMARLGGSDSLSRISKNGVKTSRAVKRPSDDLGGLVDPSEYVGDDWLVDDVEDTNTSRSSKSRPFKRPKTTASGQNLGNLGWKKTNSVKTTPNSGEFSSSFLTRNDIREKNGSKNLVSTTINDFLPESKDPIIIYDPEIQNSVLNTNNARKDVSSSSGISQPSRGSVISEKTELSQNATMRIKVKINGKMFLIAVPGRTKTIGWLCERVTVVYKQNTGLEPKVALYTGGNPDEDEACLLSHDDVVSEVLQSNEHVTAKIESWNTVELSQKYKESCAARKQVVHPVILAACRRFSTVGKLDLSNKGLMSVHLEPLVANFTQQEISSVMLPGNMLRDSGIASLCEALQNQMTLNSPSSFQCRLTELNLRCTNLTQTGLKRLACAAESGSLKSLQFLDVSYNRFGDSCLDELSSILRFCKNLKTFAASRCRFSHKLFQANYPAFKTVMQDCKLSSIDVSHNPFGSIGCELLFKSFSHSAVTEINLSAVCDLNNALITRHVVLYLKKEDCSLRTLRIAQNHLTLTQLSEFATELRNIDKISLRAVDFSKNVKTTEEAELSHLLSLIECIEECSVGSGHHKWKKNETFSNRKERDIQEFEFGANHDRPVSV